MLESARIRNFRNLIDLQIEGLDRVNLFTGRNNSGKTTLLEALFLITSGGNPGVALKINAFRGIELTGGKTTVVRETQWKPLFCALNMGEVIMIEANQRSRESLSLRISLERPGTIDLLLGQPSEQPAVDVLNEGSLLFSFERNGDAHIEGRMRLTGNGIQIDQPASNVPVPTAFLWSRSGNLQEDAIGLGQLRQRKQADMVLEALRVVEPRLQSVEDNSASGTPMIWGDIGLSELVPLPVMGEGMTRIARLIVAISSMPGGLVLVDEIENGLHHSILSKVWKAVDQAAKNFDVQIVATTHSYECMEAAHQGLGKDGFRLYRLEAKSGKNRCVAYEPEAIEAAIYHNLEVR